MCTPRPSKTVVLLVATCGMLLSAGPAAGHVILDEPDGGEFLLVDSVITIEWHIDIVHNLLKQYGLRRARGIRALDPTVVRPYAVLFLGVVVLASLEVVARPSAWVAGGAAVLVSTLVLGINRSTLNVPETFPELGRIPWLGRWLGSPPPRERSDGTSGPGEDS